MREGRWKLLVNADGTLTYSFVESVKATYPYYVIRFAGGLLYLTGMVVMAYNTYMTVRDAKPVALRVEVVGDVQLVDLAVPEQDLAAG